MGLGVFSFVRHSLLHRSAAALHFGVLLSARAGQRRSAAPASAAAAMGGLLTFFAASALVDASISPF